MRAGGTPQEKCVSEEASGSPAASEQLKCRSSILVMNESRVQSDGKGLGVASGA
ncbi:hypothetical protein NBRC111894_3848 [Sporolactobacillus inulinus]|uniref:Uncharacterized protein n=1 Tax=Sporolactobacillus inulinus TaxID=2078 RepID=A0A4Y1ZHC0_9BACL|nr:hypothetical protein NBRC111894_3848 [Sporolactobacillus inulinus]